jgi:Zn-dependent metalloprotease
MDHTATAKHTDCCMKISLESGHPLEFDRGATLQRHPSTGVARSVKGDDLAHAIAGLTCFQDLMAERRYGEAAVCFLDAFRSAFKLQHPSRELVPISVHTDDLNMTRVRLRQMYADRVVWPCEISVHISAAGKIFWVTGNTIPTPQTVNPTARLSASDAMASAAKALGIDLASCSGCEAELMVYAGDPETPILAYRVSAGTGLADAWDVFVDAESGKILKKLTRVRTQTGS